MTKTKPFDPAEYLDDSESIAVYMSEVLESENPAFVADGLRVVAQACGKTASDQDLLNRLLELEALAAIRTGLGEMQKGKPRLARKALKRRSPLT